MLERLTLALALLCISFTVSAQRTIQGTVTDETKESLIGVNILVKGTSSGTVTDLEGNYSLSVPAGYNTLVFSYTGYAGQEVEIGTSNILDVTLSDLAVGLDEVVVVGYGTQIKADLTGNIAKVSGKDIEAAPVTSFESAIQGRTSGVHIEKSSGKLGEGMKVRVRGNSSISASNQPLFVVDGIPITSEDQGINNNQPTSPLVDINSADIESIEILKDASAAAIYGSRASNGVVIITTKRGKEGKTSINLNVQSGFSSPTNKIGFLNAEEYREIYTEATLRYLGIDPIIATEEEKNEARQFLEDVLVDGFNSDFETDTNWEDEAFNEEAGFTKVDLSASGGSDKTQFYAGLSYHDEEGILIGNKLERLSGRLNLDQDATDKLRFGLGLNVVRTQLDRVSDDNAFSTPLQLIALAPTQSSRLEDGKPNPNTIYYNGLIQLENSNRLTEIYRTLGNVYGVYEFFPGFSFRSDFGIDVLDQQEDNFLGRETLDGAPAGLGESRSMRVINYNTNNFFSFDRALNENNDIQLVLGLSFQQSESKETSIQATGFPNDDLTTIASAAEPVFTSSTATAFSFLSYFARANYKLMNRYLLGLSGRIDGSSKFGEDNRYGFFPAVSAGWIISQEPFLANSNQVSFLKLRASYGVTGNAPSTNFASLATWDGNNYTTTSGLTPGTLPSPALQWETTRQFDIGLDIGLFRDRLTLELDYYQKNTEDLLLSRPLPAISGFTSIFENVGEMQNKGFEVVLNTRNFVQGFKWSTSFNIALNHNEVTQLNSDADIIAGVNRVRVGEPLGVFVTRRYAGVDSATGDALYDDGEGGTTSNYNAAPNMVVGDPNPDFVGGLLNNFSFKGFDLNIFFQFVVGNEVYNDGGQFQSNNASGFVDNQTKDQLRRWRQPGDITDIPRAELVGNIGAQESSRYLSDGSYVRFKTLSIGYTIPSRLMQKWGIASARVYVTGQNLITLTDYKGWDPEVNYTGTGRTDTNTNIIQGTDFYTAPQARTITFGLNLGF
ncbi:MAG: SusC/RagA family TonB-linked outer membrane protein [Saprospiraceae bacterium]|nr:MAG: SusC/RagA family TonB-linked outer membrane protein [Saprospiraceae bacterium]